MSDFDNTNSGAMFVNDRKQNERSPDFKGNAEPKCPHCHTSHKFWISGWKKKAKNGNGFLSLAFTPDDAEVNSSPAPVTDNVFDPDEDIPF